METEAEKLLGKNLINELNRIWEHEVDNLPSYRYYSPKGSKDQYFYTTEKIKHKGGKRYVAGIYRYLKTRKTLKLIKKVGFARKKKAIDWAFRHCYGRERNA